MSLLIPEKIGDIWKTLKYQRIQYLEKFLTLNKLKQFLMVYPMVIIKQINI